MGLPSMIDDLPAAMRFVRQWRGKSLRDVADETGVSFSTLQRIEAGKALRTMRIDTVEAVGRWVSGGSMPASFASKGGAA